MNYGSLPTTGASIAIGGIVLGQGALVAIAVGLILSGALLIRGTFRRNKTLLDV